MNLKSQITVLLENQPGTMSKVCNLMLEQGINIHAFTLFGTVDHGVLRIVCDQTDKAIGVLSDVGFLAIESKVIEIPAENSPGTLHSISALLFDKGVNIEYGYGSTSFSSSQERFFLQASDNQKALRILNKKYPTGISEPPKK